MMENTKIIKALRLCAKSGNIIDYCELGDNNDCPYSDNCGDCIDNLLRTAADALEEYMKMENALRTLIDGRGDPVSCNVDAILKGEYE